MLLSPHSEGGPPQPPATTEATPAESYEEETLTQEKRERSKGNEYAQSQLFNAADDDEIAKLDEFIEAARQILRQRGTIEALRVKLLPSSSTSTLSLCPIVLSGGL